MNTYYKIKSNHLQFQILQTQILSNKTSYLLLSAEGKECVSLKVLNKNHELGSMSIRFNRKCAMNRYLIENGSQTIQMVKAFLTFIISKESFQKISFVDTSHFNCNIPNNDLELLEEKPNSENELFNNFGALGGVLDHEIGVPQTYPVPLMCHNITIHGKTWYERHFGATFTHIHDRELVDNVVKKLHTIITKDSPIYETLHKLIHRKMDSTYVMYYPIFATMLELMESGVDDKSWMNLFNSWFGSNGHMGLKYKPHVPCALYYIFHTHLHSLFELPYYCGDSWSNDHNMTLEMELSYSTILEYPAIENLGENYAPVHKRMWGGRTKEDGTRNKRKRKNMTKKLRSWLQPTYFSFQIGGPSYRIGYGDFSLYRRKH